MDVILSEFGSCNTFMSTLMDGGCVVLILLDKSLILSESVILWFSDSNCSISAMDASINNLHLCF